MEWLSQNWMWLVVAGGAIWFLSRGRHGGMMGGCGAHGAGHGGAGDAKAHGTDAPPPPVKETTEAAAERPASSHRHGRGGCC